MMKNYNKCSTEPGSMFQAAKYLGDFSLFSLFYVYVSATAYSNSTIDDFSENYISILKISFHLLNIFKATHKKPPPLAKVKK